MIISTATIKGGTGKSTTAAALLQAAAADGKTCLGIDLDPQGNLTSFLAAERSGAYEMLHGQHVRKVLQHTSQNIDVIAGSADLATETTKPGSSKRLAKAIQPIKGNYDLIVIDTPPQMGELTYLALMAADGLLIPLEADTSSLQGLYKAVDIAHEVQKVNNNLRILGTVITRYDSRPKLNRYLKDVIDEKGSEIGAPLIGTIRQAVAVKEAQAMQESLYSYAPNCKAAQDYQALLYILLDRKI